MGEQDFGQTKDKGEGGQTQVMQEAAKTQPSHSVPG